MKKRIRVSILLLMMSFMMIGLNGCASADRGTNSSCGVPNCTETGDHQHDTHHEEPHHDDAHHAE
ncbi:MAG: hypothetical protein Q4F21_07605 [Lachnospiraceae bacterium]|nr:hypothetical protein [Lachnospiraceae bacterium]